MEQAITAYEKITVTPEFRELERQRSLTRHNEASALCHAEEVGRLAGRQEGMREGRQAGRQEGMQEGRQAGRQEGMQEGRQAGRQEGMREIIELLKSGKSPDDIIREAEV